MQEFKDNESLEKTKENKSPYSKEAYNNWAISTVKK